MELGAALRLALQGADVLTRPKFDLTNPEHFAAVRTVGAERDAVVGATAAVYAPGKSVALAQFIALSIWPRSRRPDSCLGAMEAPCGDLRLGE